MPHPDRDPLAATRRLLVDGNNLLHALSKTATAAPASALIGRLRGVIPAAVTIELVFDGPPEHGLRNERIAAAVVVRYSGGRTADSVIITMIEDVRLVDGADGTATLLVVTDDRDLRHGARLRGARTAGSAWLLGRLAAGRLASPSVGNPRPARPHRTAASLASLGTSEGDPTEDEAARWSPGRGATTKKGNPRRAPRTAGRDGGQRGCPKGRTGRMPP
jgi:predicted RNA-binding protein with PIN domain